MRTLEMLAGLPDAKTRGYHLAHVGVTPSEEACTQSHLARLKTYANLSHPIPQSAISLLLYCDAAIALWLVMAHYRRGQMCGETGGTYRSMQAILSLR